MNKASLPDGWRRVQLGDVATFSKGSGITKKQIVKAGLPCIRYGELYTRQHFQIDTFYSFINRRDHKKIVYIKNNDLLFAGSGETREAIGKCASFNLDIDACAGGDVIICSIDSSNLLANFASYYLNTIGRKSLNRLGQGNAIVHIYSKFLKTVTITLPPLPEQKAIASLIEQWDTASEKTEALIAAKKHQFKWLRSSLIGNSKITTANRFGNLLSESRIIDRRNDPRRRITVRLHLKGVKIRKYRGNEIEGATQHFVRKKGQLIYGTQNVSRGAIGIIPATLDGYCSSKDIPAFDIADNVCSDWLFWYMSRPSFYEKLAYFATGSGSKRLHPSDLFKVAIGLPSTSEQQRVAKILNTNHREIELLQKQAQQYRSQKRGLMQKLLTGEWRIRRCQTNHQKNRKKPD